MLPVNSPPVRCAVRKSGPFLVLARLGLLVAQFGRAVGPFGVPQTIGAHRTAHVADVELRAVAPLVRLVAAGGSAA
jgi:hypothetical protein